MTLKDIAMTLSLPALQPGLAYFLDFDGTLTEIAERPDAVIVEEMTHQALAVLHEKNGGALAVITGREIAALDAFLHPLVLPAAGVHGMERRTKDGITVAGIDELAAQAVYAELEPLVRGQPGLLLEKKRGALALHYRLRPDMSADCLIWMEQALAPHPAIVLTRGKMVIEARFHQATKGTAIHAFLAEPPFKGRIPLFAGDDVTDEDGFQAVNALGGISIKVGPGETAARHRAASVRVFLDWLTETAETIKKAGIS